MPITIKTGVMKYKDPTTGEYIDFNAVQSEATTEQIAEIVAKGEEVKDDIDEKAAEAIASIPEDYTELNNAMMDLKTNIVLQQTTQPVSENNHIWFPDTVPEGI